MSVQLTSVPPQPRVRLFGQYLVEEGVIQRCQLDEALNLMTAINATLGELAVERGLITVAQADEINRLQHHIDGRWGELAITLQIGRIDAQILEDLCWEQQTTNMRLTDALVDIGALSSSEVEEQLRRFEAEQSTADPHASLPATYRHFAPARAVLDALPRFAGRVLRNPLRISNARRWDPSEALAHSATASVSGTFSLAVGFTVDVALGATFALRVGPPDEDPALAVGRFAARLCDLLERRATGDAWTGAPHIGQLPRRGVQFDLAFGDGSGKLVLERRRRQTRAGRGIAQTPASS